MTKKIKPSSPPLSAEDLMHELLQAHRELVPQEKGETIPPSYFVVAKLVSNLDTRAWEKICAECLPEGWYTLELNEMSAFVHMANLTTGKRLGSSNLEGQVLMASPFLLQAEKEIIRAKRGTAPLALVRLAFSEGCAFPLERALPILYEAMIEHGDICDTLGVLDTQNYALLLPGAKPFKAQSLVEDILDACAEKQLFLHAGIAHVCPDAKNVQILLENAAEAVHTAQRDNTPLRMYKKPAKSLDETRTLVLSHEKRFLFGGGHEV